MKRIRPSHHGTLSAAGLWVLLALAPSAHAADALNGKSLYLNGPTWAAPLRIVPRSHAGQ
jgi:hypothetical protein